MAGQNTSAFDADTIGSAQITAIATCDLVISRTYIADYTMCGHTISGGNDGFASWATFPGSPCPATGGEEP